MINNFIKSGDVGGTRTGSRPLSGQGVLGTGILSLKGVLSIGVLIVPSLSQWSQFLKFVFLPNTRKEEK